MEICSFDGPFRHWLLKGVVEEDAESLFRAAADHAGPWIKYDNDCERHKRTTVCVRDIGPLWAALFANLLSSDFVSRLRTITGVDSLLADEQLYGGGCHITDPGGSLQPHLDFSIHPKTGLERRISLVLFLNPTWRRDWGGALVFLDDAGSKVIKRFYPEEGTAVLWESSDIAFHGTESTAEYAPPRVTAAAYYFAPPRAGVIRKRSLFVPRRML